LFGDSITQRGFEVLNNGWAALLANDYVRRADVINRGYGGYTTRWCKYVLPHILPPPSESNNIILFVIFLDANDSVVQRPNIFSLQHVPILEYKENLKELISIIRSSISSSLPIILVTTPLSFPPTWNSNSDSKRSLFMNFEYAEAVREVALAENVAIANFNKEMKVYATKGSSFPKSFDILENEEHLKKCKSLDDLLCDGLHLSKKEIFGSGMYGTNAIKLVLKYKSILNTFLQFKKEKLKVFS
jgi:lysophospholipase L1-like esterase